MPASPEAESGGNRAARAGRGESGGNVLNSGARGPICCLKARRYQDAANELSGLLEQAPPDKMAAMQAQVRPPPSTRLAKRDDAEHLFENLAQEPGCHWRCQGPGTLLFGGSIAWIKTTAASMPITLRNYEALRRTVPWFQEALLSGGQHVHAQK